MEQIILNKGPVAKSKVGKFQISLWRIKKLRPAEDDFDAEKEFTIERACVQYSRYNRATGNWDRQNIWFNANELRDLSNALDGLGPAANGGDA